MTDNKLEHNNFGFSLFYMGKSSYRIVGTMKYGNKVWIPAKNMRE